MVGNKKRLVFILLIIFISAYILLFGTACSITKSKNISIADPDSGKQIVLPINGILTVTLVSGIAEGYSWNEITNIDNSQVIKQTAYEYRPVVPEIPEIGKQIWTFQAIGVGTSTLSNDYCEIAGTKQLKHFTLIVVVK